MKEFQVGDLVAHKHYPENAIGKISKFYSSGRVGVDDGSRPRSFLPSSLILWGEKIAPGEPEKLEDAIADSEVMEHPPTHPLSLLQKFEAIAEVEASFAEEMDQPARFESDNDDFSQGCPKCESAIDSLEITPLGVKWDIMPDYHLVICENCRGMWLLDKLPDSLKPDEPVKSAIANESITLSPVPRDFSDLKEWPKWWERPVLEPYDPGNFFEGDDGDYVWDWQESDDYLRTYYRDWLLVIYDSEIEATPPNSDKKWCCECEQDIDGLDGKIAIAQEFIDSWYFAQISPGQLSLNIIETVARDPPPPPRLIA